MGYREEEEAEGGRWRLVDVAVGAKQGAVAWQELRGFSLIPHGPHMVLELPVGQT